MSRGTSHERQELVYVRKREIMSTTQRFGMWVRTSQCGRLSAVEPYQSIYTFTTTTLTRRPLSRPLAVAVRYCSDTMPKAIRIYYAVKVGKRPGIYTTWEDCLEQVNRYPHAVFKKLRTLDAAEAWVRGYAGGLPGPVEQRGTPNPTKSEIKPADGLPSHNQTRASVGPSSSTQVSSSSSANASTPARSGSGSRSRSRSPPLAGLSDAPLSVTAGPSKPTGSSSSTAFEDVVYTDGACSKNGQVGSVAGIGVWWGPSDPRNLSERCPGNPQTNNRAELIAIIRALETAPTTAIPLVIRTDSKYSMKCIKAWLPGWRRHNFRTSQGTRVKNSELVMYADALISMREQAGQRVLFQYVPGHAGEVGNEGADALAVRGSKLREVHTRNWGELKLQLEEATKKKTAVIAESGDASMFADMVLDEEQLLAELEDN